jgi:hypothetical protein
MNDNEKIGKVGVDDEIVKKEDLGDIVTRIISLLIGMGLFFSDKILHKIEPSLGMEVYGAIAMVALGYTPNIQGMFKK